jgi:Fanconi anemia group M protein
LQSALQGRIASGEKDFEIMKSISQLAEALKIEHALGLLETQGLEQLVAYLNNLEKQAVSSKVKAVKNLVKDPLFRMALVTARKYVEKKLEHPKLVYLKNFVKREIEKDSKQKIIIFTQYRDTVLKLKSTFDSVGVNSKMFVGQMKKKETGLSQKEQKKILEEFSKGDFNCLISTSVGEEGLDIPQVDLVIFYEPIPSAIRTVQRRGRTGRNRKGGVVVLVAKGTRDEAYRWVAHHKEKRMYRSINSLKNVLGSDSLSLVQKKEDLLRFIDPEKVTIYVDHREKSSGVVKELVSLGVNVDLKTLKVGDYLLSDVAVVEYKTVSDFVDSIIDGRLLGQLKDLVSYKKPILVIEGTEDIYSQRNIHPNAIRGMFSTISVSYRIPILFTKNPKDTANLLFIIARREQDPNKKDFQMHQAKPLTLKEQQEYVVSSLPGIGSSLAPFLLKQFKTLKRLFNSSEKEMEKVEQIGKKKASAIKDLIESEYEE